MSSARFEEHLVERGDAGREPVERELEPGDEVAQRVEVVVAADLDLDDAVGGHPDQARRAERGGEPFTARTDIDRHGARALEERVGRAGDHEATRVDHHDVVADLLHVVE